MPDITLAEVNALLGVADATKVLHMLDLIGWTEGTADEDITNDDGYDVIVTGMDTLGTPIHEEIFSDYSTHPFAKGKPPMIIQAPCPKWPHGLLSTASGRYQILLYIFRAYYVELHLPDFSPLSQDRIAIQLVKERRDADHISAITHLLNGNFTTAIELCNGIWASLPGNVYGQGGKSMTACLAKITELEAAN